MPILTAEGRISVQFRKVPPKWSWPPTWDGSTADSFAWTGRPTLGTLLRCFVTRESDSSAARPVLASASSLRISSRSLKNSPGVAVRDDLYRISVSGGLGMRTVKRNRRPRVRSGANQTVTGRFCGFSSSRIASQRSPRRSSAASPARSYASWPGVRYPNHSGKHGYFPSREARSGSGSSLRSSVSRQSMIAPKKNDKAARTAGDAISSARRTRSDSLRRTGT